MSIFCLLRASLTLSCDHWPAWGHQQRCRVSGRAFGSVVVGRASGTAATDTHPPPAQAAVTKLRDDSVVVPLHQQAPSTGPAAGGAAAGGARATPAARGNAAEGMPVGSAIDPDLADAAAAVGAAVMPGGTQRQQGLAGGASAGGGVEEPGGNASGMAVPGAQPNDLLVRFEQCLDASFEARSCTDTGTVILQTTDVRVGSCEGKGARLLRLWGCVGTEDAGDALGLGGAGQEQGRAGGWRANGSAARHLVLRHPPLHATGALPMLLLATHHPRLLSYPVVRCTGLAAGPLCDALPIYLNTLSPYSAAALHGLSMRRVRKLDEKDLHCR